MTLEDHVKELEKYPDIKVTVRKDKDGFIIVNRKYEP